MKQKIIYTFLSILMIGNLYAESAASLYSKGVTAYLNRDFKTAAFMWQSVLEKNPNNKKAQTYMEKAYDKYNKMQTYFYTGLKYFKENDCTNAIDNFQQTLFINPNHKKAIYYLNLTYQNCKNEEAQIVKADKAFTNKDYQSAVSLYRSLVQLNPDDEILKFKLKKAETLLNEEDRKKAIRMHLEAAQQFSEKEQYAFSIPEWNKVLVLDATNATAIEGLKKDKALKLIQEKNNKIDSLITKGIDNFTSKKYLQARDNFKNVLFLDEHNATALKYIDKIKTILKSQESQRLSINEAEKHFNIGLAQYNKQKYYDALEEFKISLSFNTNNEKVISYIKKTQNKIAELEKAEEEKRNRQIQKWLEEGVTYYQLSQYKDAKNVFLKILEVDSENAVAKQYLTLIRDALKFLKNSIVTRDSPYYYIYLKLFDSGKKAFNNKNYELATHYFQQIIDLFPLNKEANKYLLRTMYYTDKTKFETILQKHIKRGKKYLKQQKIKAAKNEFLIVKDIIPDYKDIDKLIASCVYKPKVDIDQIKKQYNLGVLAYSKKEWQNAIEAWNKVVKMDSSPNSNPYYGNAIVNIRKAKRRLGLPTLKPTKKTTSTANAQLIRKHHYMGIAYYTDGKYDKAIKEWNEVLKLDPNNIQAIKNIKKAKKKLEYLK